MIATDAIVVRVVDYGEADRIAALLTRDLGRVSAMARAARKSKKRFGGALAALSRGRATLVERRSDLLTFEAFEPTHDPLRLSGDLGRFAHAAYALELAYELSPPRQADPGLYALVEGMLDRLEREPASAAALRWFELRVLDHAGIGPALDRCAGCGRGDVLDRPLQAFDPAAGGVVCGACRGPRLPALDGEARRAMLAARAAARAGDAPALEPAANAAFRDATLALIRQHLPRPLRALEFIEGMGVQSGRR